jgi:dienelactone hydrolase
MTRISLLLVAAVAAAAATTVAFRVHSSAPRQEAQAAVGAIEEEETGLIAWCADGLVPIGGGGCFAAPPGEKHDVPLILYLHGIYDRHADYDEHDRQRRVAKLSTARGFAVLALRGLEGGCSLDPELASKYCWPSNERTAARGPETVSEWQAPLRAAARRGAGGPRYVLGFSNGGFFAGLLAVRAWFDADGFAIGNAGPVEPIHALGVKAPLLLMSASEDASQEGMARLDDELTREAWPHEKYSRAGTHELTDPEIEAALSFFVRVGDEKVALASHSKAGP